MRHQRRGKITLRPRLYFSTKNNELGSTFSKKVLTGTVTADASQETPMQFQFQTRDLAAFPAFSWVAPHLTLQWWDPEDGLTSETEQLGLFQVMPQGETHTASQGIGRIVAMDPTWMLKNWTTTAALNYASSANVISSVKTLLTGCGLTRNNIPAKSTTFGEKKAYEAGSSILDIINELLMRVGYYPLWCDRHGIPTSRPFRTLRKEEPTHIFSTYRGEIVGTVSIDPDPTQLCNRVTVTANDANRDPFTITKTNTRVDSPVSTVNLDGQVIGKKIEASNIDSLTEAKALVNKTLEEGAAMMTRLELQTIPFLDFNIRDVMTLIVYRDDDYHVASDKWFTDYVEIGFTPRQGAQKWRFNKLIPFDPEDEA